MKTDNQKKGALGEDAVCEELIRRGHTIVARNYHKRSGEIDIISRIGDYIVFTEVKTRKLGSMISGLEAVNRRKQEKIVKTSDIYLTENPCELWVRYDVAEVWVTSDAIPKITRIDICEEAFTADGIYTLN